MDRRGILMGLVGTTILGAVPAAAQDMAWWLKAYKDSYADLDGLARITESQSVRLAAYDEFIKQTELFVDAVLQQVEGLSNLDTLWETYATLEAAEDALTKIIMDPNTPSHTKRRAELVLFKVVTAKGRVQDQFLKMGGKLEDLQVMADKLRKEQFPPIVLQPGEADK